MNSGSESWNKLFVLHSELISSSCAQADPLQRSTLSLFESKSLKLLRERTRTGMTEKGSSQFSPCKRSVSTHFPHQDKTQNCSIKQIQEWQRKTWQGEKMRILHRFFLSHRSLQDSCKPWHKAASPLQHPLAFLQETCFLPAKWKHKDYNKDF